MDRYYNQHSVQIKDKIYDQKILQAKLQKICFLDCTTIWAVAATLGVSKSTLFCLIHKEGVFCVHTNTVKPTLLFENKQHRLKVSTEFAATDIL